MTNRTILPEDVTPEVKNRFRDKINIKDGDNCWEWQGAKTIGGYGNFKFNGVPILAHRMSWVIEFQEEIPQGMHVCHYCDNPGCVNPEHLFLGTDADNVKDMYNKGRDNARKLTEKQVLGILAIPKPAPRGSMKALAEKFGVSQACLEKIRGGYNWSYLHRKQQDV